MHHARSPLLLALPVALVALLLALPGTALAHERRTIASGKYDVVVGWDVEPAYLGQKNAASIRISQAGSNPAVPVTGAEKTLKLQIKQGASAQEFPLRAVFGQNGYYVADIIPERTGEYQFTFTGSIDGNPVNETFDSADKKFNGVEPTASLQFPASATADPAQALAAAQQAQADAASARTFGLAGLIVGALGLVAAAGAWLSRPRTGAAAAQTHAAAEHS